MGTRKQCQPDVQSLKTRRHGGPVAQFFARFAQTKTMAPEPNTRPSQTDEQPLAETGNASNPSPQATEMEPMSDNQLLTEDAEKYLRESGNIEDMPDAQDQAEAEKAE